MNRIVKAIYLAVLKEKSGIRLFKARNNEYTVIIEDAVGHRVGYKVDSNPIYVLAPDNKSRRLNR